MNTLTARHLIERAIDDENICVQDFEGVREFLDILMERGIHNPNELRAILERRESRPNDAPLNPINLHPKGNPAECPSCVVKYETVCMAPDCRICQREADRPPVDLHAAIVEVNLAARTFFRMKRAAILKKISIRPSLDPLGVAAGIIKSVSCAKCAAP